MDFFLDTHTFLWYVSGNSKLSARIRAIIDDDRNRIVLSVVSLWEIVIKVSLGKLEVRGTIEEVIRVDVQGNEIKIIPIAEIHLKQLESLPHHHRDPFDRMIVAQALAEKTPLISNDATLDAYGIQRIW